MTSQRGGPRQTEKCATHGEVKVKLLSLLISPLSFKKSSLSIIGFLTFNLLRNTSYETTAFIFVRIPFINYTKLRVIYKEYLQAVAQDRVLKHIYSTLNSNFPSFYSNVDIKDVKYPWLSKLFIDENVKLVPLRSFHDGGISLSTTFQFY